MPNLPIDPVILTLGLITLLITIAYLREYNLRKNLQKEGEKILQGFKDKGLENLHKSIEKSQDIIGNAELEAVKVVADTKFENTRVEKEYEKKLNELLSDSQKTIAQSQQQLIQFMDNLQKRGADFELASQRTTQQKVNELFEHLEAKLSDFLVTTEQKTTSSIELELRASTQLVDAYRAKQFKLIDENIVALMEQTLNLVLAKKLTLNDQLELVYDALETAKAEKFVA